jgi:hypothetical protein
MPLFITYASYSNTGIKGIIDKPIDRTEAIRTLAEKAGGKLIAAYMTTGPHDVAFFLSAMVSNSASARRPRWQRCLVVRPEKNGNLQEQIALANTISLVEAGNGGGRPAAASRDTAWSVYRATNGDACWSDICNRSGRQESTIAKS